MTENLYYREGGIPAVLPFQAFTPEGLSRTDLANHPGSIAECGFILAPPRPADTETQTSEWDREAEAWVMADKPLAPLQPDLEPEPGPVVLYPADLWRRTTNAEAEAIDAAMEAQPLRIRRLFDAAQTYQSNDPLWPLLTGAAEQLFGEARAAELLAPS